MSQPRADKSRSRIYSVENSEFKIKLGKKKKKKKRHHKHHHKKESLAYCFDITQGVSRVVLSPIVQAQLKCIVGETITSEKPWKKIKKDFIQEQIENEEVPLDYQVFLPYKIEILEYPGEEMLVGYIPDESREYDEFYFCLNLDAEATVYEVISRVETAQNLRLKNALNKTINPWITLGSEVEVDNNIPVNNRGLYKVELETKYPIMNPEVRFKPRLVENARDGYVECLTASRYMKPNINKKRIHTETQVAPTVCTKEAQTNCGYPINNWTQYEYNCERVEHISNEFLETFQEYVDGHIEKLDDDLYVNGNINFYTSDYTDLSVKEKTEQQSVIVSEYMSFKDIKRCKDKMISAMCWHPIWTGIVALAYANHSPLWVKKNKNSMDDRLSEAVHGQNPVLIWSFNDGLSPKLILETYSEVHTLEFCPHNENMLIGGCLNGQIVLWDITNKLNKVEEEEISTPTQQLYRTIMFSMMKWMKNTRDISVVPQTATSELSFTHLTNVTGLKWIHPHFIVNKTGQLEKVSDSTTTSLQFISSSADGTVKFWDLKQKPVMLPGDYKPQKKSRRLGKRPSALTLDVSPFRILNRKLRPHFQLNVELPKATFPCPIRSITLPYDSLKYVEVDPNKKCTVAERNYYKPVLDNTLTDMFQDIAIGTYLGDFILGSWDGYDYLSGDLITVEQMKCVNLGRYHDGPVVYCKRHPVVRGLFLTIGGKVFALWSSQLKGKPILWRRSRHRYTHGEWSRFKICGFRLNRSDGNREIWNLDFRSDKYHRYVEYSGKTLLEGQVHPRPMEHMVAGICDDKGTLRLVFVNVEISRVGNEKIFLKKLVSNSATRAIEFTKWQESWIEKHAAWIMKQREDAIAEQKRKQEELQLQMQQAEELKIFEAEAAAKRAAALLKPPPGQYEEWANEQWITKEQERMGNVLLSMKRLDKETLIRQQAPLKKIEVDEERKRHKQRVQLSKSDDIFKNTIAMLFPDLMETDDDKSIGKVQEIFSSKLNYFDAYHELLKETTTFVDENPFIYKFNWKKMIDESQIKKKKSEFKRMRMHHTRYESEKKKNMEDSIEKDEDDNTTLQEISEHDLIDMY